MRKFWFAQFCVACSLAVLLLNGSRNVAAQQKEKYVGSWHMICTVPDFTGGSCPDFDVLPKEWDGPDTHAANTCAPPDDKGTTGPCTAIYIEEKTHHRACEDMTRFLMGSEDGKWHCLKLTP